MPAFHPDISLLYNAAFGLVGRFITYPLARTVMEKEGAEINFPGVEIVSREEAIQLSYLGTPIMYPVTFKGGFYKVYNNKGEIIEKSLADFRLPLATLVDFQRVKIKQKTRVVGSNSSVKEMYGHDNWQIRIRGLCLDDPKHPQLAQSFLDQHARLLEFEELADSIQVEGDLFKEKSIYRLDINDISFPQLQGKPRVLPFEMTCESDEPLELILL